MCSCRPPVPMKLRSRTLRAAVLLLFLPLYGRAQEGTWTFSLSGGIFAPGLSVVNETLDKTIRDWNEIQQVPIRSIDHFSSAPSFGVRGSYRFDRDISVVFSAAYSKQSVQSSYRDTIIYLDLDRSVQTTDVMLGFSYHLPPLVFDMEVSILVDVGLMFARADALSYNTREEKVGAVTVTVVYYDSEAIYRKTKLIADAGVLWTWGAFQPFFLKAEALYKFANMGKMNGDIRRLQGAIQEQTVTDFDFSGFSASVGIGISF